MTGLSFDLTEELARLIAKAGLNGIGVPGARAVLHHGSPAPDPARMMWPA